MEEPYLSILSSLLSGLVGAAVVYYYGIRQDARQRRLAFLERQLTEFYAPLAGLRKQIRAKSELRKKVFDATAAAADQSTAIIEYHNKQFLEELIPKYRQMLALFTERYHFADAQTREFYPLFLEYVEVWNLWLAESISADGREDDRPPRRERQALLRAPRAQNAAATGRDRSRLVAVKRKNHFGRLPHAVR